MQNPLARPLATLALASALVAGQAETPETWLPSEARRVVFVGDSITYSGQYIVQLEAWFRTRHPDRSIEFINVGLPSETVSGLSEPGHAGGRFPRPDLHERLDRVLNALTPDLLVACYGMNCGIYHPYAQERFQAYQDGILRLRHKAADRGIPVVHLTPPVFDAVPIAGRTLPAGEPEYRRMYAGYDEVLDLYGAWLMAQRGRGWTVIDVHGPMHRHLEVRRVQDPAYTLAGDGVHINETGHWLMARELLAGLGAEPSIVEAESPKALFAEGVDADAVLKEIAVRQRLLSDAWLTRTGHLRPGMREGLPIEEAVEQAAAIDVRIRAALTTR